MNPKRSKLESLGPLLQGVLNDLGDGDSARGLRIAQRWGEIVGPEVGRHCRPTGVRGEVLEVAVDSSVWSQELSLRIPEILRALRQAFGDDAPTDLWLHVETFGPGPGPGPGPGL